MRAMRPAATLASLWARASGSGDASVTPTSSSPRRAANSARRSRITAPSPGSLAGAGVPRGFKFFPADGLAGFSDAGGDVGDSGLARLPGDEDLGDLRHSQPRMDDVRVATLPV